MGLTSKNKQHVGSAENTIKGFNVQYSFQHEEGSKPQFLRASATKEGEDTSHEVIYWPETNMIQTTTFNAGTTVDATLINGMIKDLQEISNGL